MAYSRVKSTPFDALLISAYELLLLWLLFVYLSLHQRTLDFKTKVHLSSWKKLHFSRQELIHFLPYVHCILSKNVFAPTWYLLSDLDRMRYFQNCTWQRILAKLWKRAQEKRASLAGNEFVKFASKQGNNKQMTISIAPYPKALMRFTIKGKN